MIPQTPAGPVDRSAEFESTHTLPRSRHETTARRIVTQIALKEIHAPRGSCTVGMYIGAPGDDASSQAARCAISPWLEADSRRHPKLFDTSLRHALGGKTRDKAKDRTRGAANVAVQSATCLQNRKEPMENARMMNCLLQTHVITFTQMIPKNDSLPNFINTRERRILLGTSIEICSAFIY